MYELKMYKKKVPKKKSTVDFTVDAIAELQKFKKRMQTDASNSTIINEMLILFLNMPDVIIETLDAECNRQISMLKKSYAAVTEPNEIERIDMEIETYQRLRAFLQPRD